MGSFFPVLGVILGVGLRLGAQENAVSATSGPQGAFHLQGAAPPARWSVASGENVLWRAPLPEGGQSGVTVVGNRLFLTVNKPLPDGTPAGEAQGSDILGLCLDATTGKLLWQVLIPGRKVMPHTGLFTDASTPTPLADERHVWIVNAAGGMMCLDHDGKQIWSRTFEVEMLHNAKNCQPMLVDGKVIHVELKDAESIPAAIVTETAKLDKNSGAGPWTWLHAFDALTGKPVWRADAATSIHSAPSAGRIGDRWVLFHARGGGHNPPEKPYGFSLTSADTGRTLWERALPSGLAFFVSHFDQHSAYAFDTGKLLSLELQSGGIQHEFDLNSVVDWCKFDPVAGKYATLSGVRFDEGKKVAPHPTPHSNILVGRHMLFLAHNRASIGRVNLDSGRVEYLDVPFHMLRKPGQPDMPHWAKHIAPDARNSRGMLVAADKRAFGSGWGHVTAAAPISVNGAVYFVTMPGTVYVIDANASDLNSEALRWVGDLGPAGETWTLAPISYSAGRLYARTLTEVVCIGRAR